MKFTPKSNCVGYGSRNTTSMIPPAMRHRNIDAERLRPILFLIGCTLILSLSSLPSYSFAQLNATSACTYGSDYATYCDMAGSNWQQFCSAGDDVGKRFRAVCLETCRICKVIDVFYTHALIMYACARAIICEQTCMMYNAWQQSSDIAIIHVIIIGGASFD